MALIRHVYPRLFSILSHSQPWVGWDFPPETGCLMALMPHGAAYREAMRPPRIWWRGPLVPPRLRKPVGPRSSEIEEEGMSLVGMDQLRWALRLGRCTSQYRLFMIILYMFGMWTEGGQGLEAQACI
jgi:hypothetical protein